MKHFETELPEGYREVFHIDAKNKKTGLIMNGIGLLLFAIALTPFVLDFFVFRPYVAARAFSRGFTGTDLLTLYLIYLAGILVYLVLHELTHGAAYKLLTGRKLTFGITWSAAYCGVPDIYVYRAASLISILAPFVVFTVLFLGLILFLLCSNIALWYPFVYYAVVLILCSHIAGCVGDLYGAFLMLFRFRNPKLLMHDTGPKQTFWLPKK